MAGALKFATGPVTWGVDFADAPGNPPWQEVLDQIAESGIGALELGPVGYLPEEPATLVPALDSRQLRAVGSFLFDDLHDPVRQAEVLEVAVRVCRLIAAAKGDVLVIIDRPGGERVLSAGRSEVAPRLSTERWRDLLASIDAIADVAREHGLRPVVHPHCGSSIEFEDEIQRLVDDSNLDLCLDLGHAAFAGIDPTSAIHRWGARLSHLHLKDVDPNVLALVRRDGLNFWQAIATGIFCPLGAGVIDFGAAGVALRDVGYQGYATIEQDRVPGAGEPLADLARSVGALEAAGLRGRPAVGGVP